jgi:hypothetical protein
MNADSSCPRLSPAEFLSERPERNQRAADTHGFGLPFIHPGFLNAAAIRGNLTCNGAYASERNRHVRPDQRRRGNAFLRERRKNLTRKIFKPKSLQPFEALIPNFTLHNSNF